MDLDAYLTDRTDRSGGPDACHLWVRSVGSHGYGNAWDGERVTVAHRLAWIAYVGPIPPGMTVDHRCATQRCVNVRHLQLLTRADNSRAEGARRDLRNQPCPHGHPASDRRVDYRGHSYCHECKRAKDRRAYELRRSRR